MQGKILHHQYSVISRGITADRAELVSTRLLIGAAAFVWLMLCAPGASAGPIEDALDDIKTKLNQIAGSTGGITSSLQDLPGLVQARLGVALDSETKDNLLETFADVRSALEDIKAEKLDVASFGDGAPGTNCFVFRNSFKSLLGGQGQLINDVLVGSAASIDPSIDLQIDGLSVAALVDLIPCPFLFPVDRALAATPLGGLATAVQRARANLGIASELALGELECEQVVEDKAYYRSAATVVFAASLFLRTVASIVDTDDMTAKGPVPIKRDIGPVMQGAEVGIHGYAALTISRPDPEKKKKRIANGLRLGADVTAAISGAAFARVLQCQTTLSQEKALTIQQEILMNQQMLLAQGQLVAENQEVLMREVCALNRFQSTECQAYGSFPPGLRNR